MKKTYICFEPGERHPVLCVVEKRSEIVGRLNPEVVMNYEVQSLEALPAGMSHIDMQEKVKSRMQKYIMGDIRFILGYTYIGEATARFFEGTSLKPVRITVTGEQELRKEGLMLFVPYSDILERIDELRAREALDFSVGASESEFADDDDCDLALGMAVWYAAQDSEQTIGKNIPGLL